MRRGNERSRTKGPQAAWLSGIPGVPGTDEAHAAAGPDPPRSLAGDLMCLSTGQFTGQAWDGLVLRLQTENLGDGLINGRDGGPVRQQLPAAQSVAELVAACRALFRAEPGLAAPQAQDGADLLDRLDETR